MRLIILLLTVFLSFYPYIARSDESDASETLFATMMTGVGATTQVGAHLEDKRVSSELAELRKNGINGGQRDLFQDYNKIRKDKLRSLKAQRGLWKSLKYVNGGVLLVMLSAIGYNVYHANTAEIHSIVSPKQDAGHLEQSAVEGGDSVSHRFCKHGHDVIQCELEELAR